MAPPVGRDNPFTRSWIGLAGLATFLLIAGVCLLTLPWTALSRFAVDGSDVLPEGQQSLKSLYEYQLREARTLPPWWAPGGRPQRPLAGDAPLDNLPDSVPKRYWEAAERLALIEIARERRTPIDELKQQGVRPSADQIAAHQPTFWLGSDQFGRSLLIRCLAGGGISITIGISAALISVMLGTLWGTLAGWLGGRVDGLMMRFVDILYGLPYILLVVLLAVAGDALVSEFISRESEIQRYVDARASERLSAGGPAGAPAPTIEQVRDWLKRQPAVRTARLEALQAAWPEGAGGAELAGVHAARAGFLTWASSLPDEAEVLRSEAQAKFPGNQWLERNRTPFDLIVLLVAIGGVSWLTMARVVRGQVLSLKNQPFIEAARAIGVPWRGIFSRHLLPNLMGPIIVYTTLTVPQAILQESFLSFLGIGVKKPLPSWGLLCAEGLSELNIVDPKWWLLLFPCLLLGLTLLAMNFMGEGLREALDPKRGRR